MDDFLIPYAWLSLNSYGDCFYWDKQDALDNCDGFIVPLYSEVQIKRAIVYPHKNTIDNITQV